jgi:hypothetical protein
MRSPAIPISVSGGFRENHKNINKNKYLYITAESGGHVRSHPGDRHVSIGRTPAINLNTLMNKDIDILISEVGPRDGLQNTKAFMPTEYKKRWIS